MADNKTADTSTESETLSELVDVAVDEFQEGLSSGDVVELKNDVIKSTLNKAEESGMSLLELAKIEKILSAVLQDYTGVDSQSSVENFKADLTRHLFQEINLELKTHQPLEKVEFTQAQNSSPQTSQDTPLESHPN